MLKNRKVAMWICVFVVTLSIFTGARSSIAEVIRETENAFVFGVDGNGVSIYHDLGTRAGLAQDLASLAEAYLGVDDAQVVAVRTAADLLKRATSPERCYDLNEEMNDCIADLNDALMEEPLTAADDAYRVTLLTDLESYAYMISHDGYNELVRELNEETLGKFPANVLKYLTFNGSAEYYR